MKILASMYINGHCNACMPTTTPLAIRTSGRALTQGKYLISGAIVCTEGVLTLVVHSASPAVDLPEFMFCAGTADHDGIIEDTGLFCDFNGPFVGKLTDIVQGDAFFESIITSNSGEAVLPGSLAVPTAAAAKNEDPAAPSSKESEGLVVAAVDAQTEDREVVITEGFLDIPFPDLGGPCPGLCAPIKHTSRQPTRTTGEPANMRLGRNFISPEEVTTF